MKELFKRLTNQVLSTTGDHVSPESLAIIISEYESLKGGMSEAEIRAEQDRLTREACAEVAGTWCLVPPDGGSPTDSETRFCDGLEQAILNTKAV